MKPSAPHVFILAQGKGTRWSMEDKLRVNHRELPDYKQLLPVGGETLVRRTLRLLREEGFTGDITLVCIPELAGEVKGYGESLTLPDPGDDILQAIVQLLPLEQRGVMLLGDVLFSRLALRRLAKGMDLTASGVLARCEPSRITVKKADEVFGFWYDADFQPEALKRTTMMIEHGRPGKPWAIPYLAMPDFAQTAVAHNNHPPALRDLIELPGMAHVCDYTDDIDSLQEYVEFWMPMEACALVDELP